MKDSLYYVRLVVNCGQGRGARQKVLGRNYKGEIVTGTLTLVSLVLTLVHLIQAIVVLMSWVSQREGKKYIWMTTSRCHPGKGHMQ